jgi:hypothetical protein
MHHRNTPPQRTPPRTILRPPMRRRCTPLRTILRPPMRRRCTPPRTILRPPMRRRCTPPRTILRPPMRRRCTPQVATKHRRMKHLLQPMSRCPILRMRTVMNMESVALVNIIIRMSHTSPAAMTILSSLTSMAIGASSV